MNNSGQNHLNYQIARSIGITYEECARLMKSLNAIVNYSRGGKIIILDWDELEMSARLQQQALLRNNLWVMKLRSCSSIEVVQTSYVNL